MTQFDRKASPICHFAQLTRIVALSFLSVLSSAAVFAQPKFFRDQESRWSASSSTGRMTFIDGQAMAALTDSEYKPIVSTFGSHVTAVLPASPLPYPHRYFIIIREERGNPATFTVSLERVGQDPATADAVNKNRIHAYCTANACKLANPICPQFRVVDKRVAQCNLSSHQCEMMPPEQIRCGGTGDGAHACPAGYTCKGTGVAGIPGVCARE